MSEECEADNTPSCCASCGIAEIDDIKLVPCDGCDLVKYCSDECRENHKPLHLEVCRKRAAELRDELLFKQPESTHLGDCPICCLPMPIDDEKKGKTYKFTMPCCSKYICKGCFCIYFMGLEQGRMEFTCPFCRNPVHTSDEGRGRQIMKRIEANDPYALFREGWEQHQKGEYSTAFEFWSKAAAMGDAEAHCRLSDMYHYGEGVDIDEGEEVYHMEEAAIGGHPIARYNLGCHENDNGYSERAVKHWIISAAQGHDGSIKILMEKFREGEVEKDDLGVALRAHKAAVDATKSKERDFAEILSKKIKD